MNDSKTIHGGATRERGRPREFDVNAALDRAILYFGEHGYNGVSIADLTDALKLSAGSIYKAFHSKHELFCSAMDRYTTVRGAKLSEITKSSESGRERLRRVLLFYAESSHAEEGRCGCLVIVGAIELANTDSKVAEKVSVSLARNEERFTAIIRDGQADGSISKQINAPAMAKTLLSVALGLRVLGKTGQARDATMAVVETAMQLLC